MSQQQQQQQQGGSGTKAEDYNDSAFQYWILFSLLIVLLPSTLWAKRQLFPKKPCKKIDCSCPGCERKIGMRIKEQQREIKSVSNYVRFGLLALLWLVFFIVLFKVAGGGIAEHEPYNPYSVLGLQTGATEEEIKKTYRKLSLLHHPDKAVNKAESEEKFIAIAKAYTALTDPAIREKWEMYGNPDGPQPISVGIALPSWLVDKNNSSIVLAIYLIALVVLVPSGVYFWRKSAKKLSSGVVSENSMGLYYHVISDKTLLKSLIEIIGASAEFKESLPERTTDEEALKALHKYLPTEHKIKKFRFNQPYIVKATTLLYVHISRAHQHLPENLAQDLQEVLGKVRMLVNGAFQLVKERRMMVPIIELTRLIQCITQSAWEEQTLKQVPYLDSFAINSLHFRKVHDIAKFKRLEPETRKEYLQDSYTAAQLQDIENVLEKIPTEVGIKYQVITEKDGIIYTTSVCTLEVEFIDKTPKKKTKQQQAADESSASAGAKSPSTEETAEDGKGQDASQENTSTSPVVAGGQKKQKGISRKKGQAAKEREEKKLMKEKKEREEQEKKERREQRAIERERRQLERDARRQAQKNGEVIDDEDDGLSDDDEDLRDTDSEHELSDSDSDWEPPAKPKKPKANDNYYHSPFVNDDRNMCWWIIFGDRIKNELVAIGKSESSEPGNTIKIQFLTPREPGQYSYSLHLMCDGYIGCDSQYTLNLDIKQNPNPIELPPGPGRAPQQPLTKKELKEQKKQKKLQ
ncbi:hypothetical protein SAMD00019534_032790 [Acytostelium subglobosum LB1]|uniref:hypothetical protein n=1 Tax=Acytostelium subglobosum LB1 TaxID=1410327 RepID=UPI000644DD1A|nr:hypothetical protein SAMD00019534_032790 [Acytostelium subglobosum LB1]GAM20104.1 hypothetical protein SAMD00019534_032790 [Acytostelium subglobosum LB1]|eukprot:XP_012756866.1 hypothetical protein SAMD00019534_032790 [Acytostelium subglobosum LB1]